MWPGGRSRRFALAARCWQIAALKCQKDGCQREPEKGRGNCCLPVTVRTVSTLSPPTELLTLQRYLPESSTLASLMINVPLTCFTRSSSLTSCLAVLPSTYLYHLRIENRATLTPHRKTCFGFSGIKISPGKKVKVHLLIVFPKKGARSWEMSSEKSSLSPDCFLRVNTCRPGLGKRWRRMSDKLVGRWQLLRLDCLRFCDRMYEARHLNSALVFR